jgi:hypothetical protein
MRSSLWSGAPVFCTARFATEPPACPSAGLSVAGERIRFGLTLAGRPIEIEGGVTHKTMTGEARAGEVHGTWSARDLGPLERK